MIRLLRIQETNQYTATSCHFIWVNKIDIISNDISMVNLIKIYDSFHSAFLPKQKPFWQTPPLPEYV